MTHPGVPEQGHDNGKRSALMSASASGMTGVVEKMLAAGANAELTDEVNGRLPMQCSDVRARHVRDASCGRQGRAG